MTTEIKPIDPAFKYLKDKVIVHDPHDGDSGRRVAYFIHTPWNAERDDVIRFCDMVEDIGPEPESNSLDCGHEHDCCGCSWESGRDYIKVCDVMWMIVIRVVENV